MKYLHNYILESLNKISPTKSWVIEHYDLFNERYFNNELPKSNEISLEVIRSKGTELGCQGEYVAWYTASSSMENGKYIMYIRPNGVPASWSATFNGKRWKHEANVANYKRVKSILELKPFIRINSIYVATENNLEDTLIHEMVHLYTYKDGLAPKQAHGAEFKRKCKEIRNLAKQKYNTEYELLTKAGSNEYFEFDDDQKEKIKNEIQKAKGKGGGVIGVYLVFNKKLMKENNFKYPERFFFCTKNMLNQLIYDIKNRAIDRKYMTNIYISEDSYEKMSNKYGKFKTIRRYQFWNPDDYPLSKTYMIESAKDIINESLNEDKKPYIQPNINIIIPSEINLSEINIEDLIELQNKETDEQTGTKENDKNIITP